MTQVHHSPAVAAPLPNPFQLGLRALTLGGVLAALACTRGASADTLVSLEVAILGLALLGAIMPDTHLGLLIVVSVVAHWLVAVDDTTTPWALGVAAGVAMTHSSMASASVAPATARWTGAMRRRWARRVVVQIGVILPVWAAVVFVGEIDIGASSVVMAGALLVIAVVGLWARHGALDRDPPGDR